MHAFELEKRHFIRIRHEVPVRYKFLSRHMEGPEFEIIYEGSTVNLGGGGLLLLGKVPNPQWLANLLTQKILIGVNLHLPAAESPIKALTRVAWLEGVDESSGKFKLGLQFRDITSDDRDKILQFIIGSQIHS